MRVKAVVFDLYGTLINIRTDEQDPRVYEELSRFLGYNRVHIGAEELREEYLRKIREQLSRSRETHPDVNVMKVFADIIHQHGEGRAELRLTLYTARLFRSLTRRVFEPFPGVYGMLERLRDRYQLGLLSDAQRCYTEPEIRELKLDWFFDLVLLSSDHGFRKPEPKYFRLALDSMGVRPADAVYVGDNPQRDLVGAKNAGMKMVLVRSTDKSYDSYSADEAIENIAELESVLSKLS